MAMHTTGASLLAQNQTSEAKISSEPCFRYLSSDEILLAKGKGRGI
jgi:hypothetical protein